LRAEKILKLMIKKNMRIALVAFNARYTHSCLALFHVRNELERRWPEVQLNFLQMTINDSSYETLLRLTAIQPDYVFFSAAIWNSDLVEELIRDLTIILPGCASVVGGPQAAVIGSNLGQGMCTVVTGPIEAVDPIFYHDLAEKNLRPRYVSSLPIKNYPFTSPYRDSDFSSHLVNRHIYYETSRGCPFSCIYCLSSTQKRILHKDLSQIKEELTQILSHRPKVVRFVDRTFNDRPDRALAIWKFLVERQTDTLYHFEISPDGFTEEMFDFLSRVPQGIFQFEIGIQSTNPETLKAVRRPMDIGRAHETVSRLASFKTIFLHADLILGLPYETPRSFYRSFSEVFSMNAHYIQMGLLKILPDTPLCHTADEYGYRYCSRPPYSILANRWLDHEKLSDLYWFCECVERFVNTRYFISLWTYLRRKGEDMAGFFLHLLSVCRSHSFFALAPTQELLGTFLIEAVSGRDDVEIIIEFMRFDWLRCGHRFLPDWLKAEGEEPAAAMKKRLYQLLPESIDGVYSSGGKNQFCKQALFRAFPEAALNELGYPDQKGEGWLCFLPKKEGDLYGLNRVVRLQIDRKKPVLS
jgi:radical SAM superfamily enzyme YgiQ (UPF0313 family)